MNDKDVQDIAVYSAACCVTRLCVGYLIVVT